MFNCNPNNKKMVIKAQNIDPESSFKPPKAHLSNNIKCIPWRANNTVQKFWTFRRAPTYEHLKKGSIIPAISSMDVNVFSSIRAATCNMEQFT